MFSMFSMFNMHVHACVHVCVHGTPSHTPIPTPTPSTHPPPPRGVDPRNHLKFDNTSTYQDISIPFEDLKSVRIPHPWVGVWFGVWLGVWFGRWVGGWVG